MTNTTPPQQPTPKSNPTPKPVAPSAPQPASQSTTPVKVVTRFAVLERLEHFILLLSFTTLAVTGLPQKFATAPLSQFVIDLFGGIEAIRGVHHLAAIVLMVLSIYHVVTIIYRVFVQRVSWTMLPVVDDFKHLWHDLLYYFGRRKHKAYYARYNYAEKAEYLAVVWGTLIMIITGFMMWNPIATTNFLPGQFIPAAKVAHGGEAVLAVLAIILWHFYHVHLRHFNKSIFVGKMTRHEMEEEHPAELALIESGKARKQIPPAVLRRRQRIFYPVASVIVVVSGILLLGFVTFEKTAIETVPLEVTGEAFVPYTPTPTLPPTPTPTPTMTPTPRPAQATPEASAGVSWDSAIGPLLNAKCTACHINAAMNDLSLKTYADALKGGKSGPAIVPNDPDKSVLVKIQQPGGHPGQLSAAELAQVITWIKAGAPEKGGAATAPSAATDVWTGGIDQLVNAKCAMCHIQIQSGGLSLKTYADALKGGQDGPAIVPDDPDKSLMVQIQQKGGHPGQFTPDEINRVIAWIKVGAPETSSGAATPATTPTPPAALSWSDFQPAFNLKCGTCHVQTQLGGLSFKTYASTLKGGKSGPAIVPNDPDKSVLVQLQRTGKHPNLLSPQEFEALLAWINAGAPETVSTTPTPAPGSSSSAPETWTSSIDQIFTAKCAACHIQLQSGGLSLKSYADALKGGQDGPVIVPNAPDKSLLVQLQQKGGHPGQLSPDELNRIIAWIKAGALEK